MPGKKPEYGQGFHNFADENGESQDPWHNRYRYGTHIEHGPKSTQSVQRTPADNTIWEEVCDVLANAYDIDARNIEVDVQNSVVFLAGTVKTRLEKIKAEQLVYNLDRVYVNNVHNKIRVDENQKSLS